MSLQPLPSPSSDLTTTLATVLMNRHVSSSQTFHQPSKQNLVTLIMEVAPSSKRSYKGADKSLARPKKKQDTATEDFEFHISYL